METRQIMTAVGVGMVAGGALGMIAAPRMRQSRSKKLLSRALKGMGDVIDDVSVVFGK